MQRWGFTYPLDAVPLPAHREVLRQAESLGYTDAWTAEVDQLDGFVPIAPAALWTETMRFGTAIANVFTRGPALLAQQASAVAEIAPGRFVLGVGASSPAIVESWNGIELRKPLERVRIAARRPRRLLRDRDDLRHVVRAQPVDDHAVALAARQLEHLLA